MRTTKELLTVLRDQIKEIPFLYYKSPFPDSELKSGVGLCNVIQRYGFFDGDEQDLLLSYVNNHRPQKGEPNFDPEWFASYWYWEPGLVAPRVAWLNEQIEKL